MEIARIETRWQELTRELAVCRRLLKARLRGQMQYRGSFVMQLLGGFILHSMELVAVLSLLHNFDDLAGWTAGEVAFLYAMANISFALAQIVAAGFEDFDRMVVRGEFDRILVRPMSAFLQILATDLSLRRLGAMAQGFVALAIALNMTDVEWTLGRATFLPIAVVSAAGLYLLLFTLEATLCFWTTEGTEAVNAVTFGGRTLAGYPLHIYDLWMRRTFLFLIPLGFVIYLPATYVLGKETPLGLPGWTQFLAPLATVAFAFVASTLWGVGIRRYRSTGS